MLSTVTNISTATCMVDLLQAIRNCVGSSRDMVDGKYLFHSQRQKLITICECVVYDPCSLRDWLTAANTRSTAHKYAIRQSHGRLIVYKY